MWARTARNARGRERAVVRRASCTSDFLPRVAHEARLQALRRGRPVSLLVPSYLHLSLWVSAARRRLRARAPAARRLRARFQQPSTSAAMRSYAAQWQPCGLRRRALSSTSTCARSRARSRVRARRRAAWPRAPLRRQATRSSLSRRAARPAWQPRPDMRRPRSPRRRDPLGLGRRGGLPCSRATGRSRACSRLTPVPARQRPLVQVQTTRPVPVTPGRAPTAVHDRVRALDPARSSPRRHEPTRRHQLAEPLRAPRDSSSSRAPLAPDDGGATRAAHARVTPAQAGSQASTMCGRVRAHPPRALAAARDRARALEHGAYGRLSPGRALGSARSAVCDHSLAARRLPAAHPVRSRPRAIALASAPRALEPGASPGRAPRAPALRLSAFGRALAAPHGRAFSPYVRSLVAPRGRRLGGRMPVAPMRLRARCRTRSRSHSCPCARRAPCPVVRSRAQLAHIQTRALCRVAGRSSRTHSRMLGRASCPVPPHRALVARPTLCRSATRSPSSAITLETSALPCARSRGAWSAVHPRRLHARSCARARVLKPGASSPARFTRASAPLPSGHALAASAIVAGSLAAVSPALVLMVAPVYVLAVAPVFAPAAVPVLIVVSTCSISNFETLPGCHELGS
jgi:hypothetical protein